MDLKMYKIYLAGGMEYAEDGESWRERATELINEKGFSTWNPYKEEKAFLEPETLEFLYNPQNKKVFFNKYSNTMYRILSEDLTQVMKSYALVVKYDWSVQRGAGTIAEMSVAAYNGVPVHVWLDGMEIEEVPAWVIGSITTVSYSLKEAVEHATLVTYERNNS